jgi:single-strand DNA-binding protein
MNLVVLSGRLAGDPASREVGEKTVINFVLAVDRDYAGNDGERETDFIKVVAWDALGEACVNHVVKGQQVEVEGSLRQRRWKDEAGNVRSVLEVVARRVHFGAKPRQG